jgi:hypothetical protein
MNAIYVMEKTPPQDVEVLEWMLLTNLGLHTPEEALEKVRWYCLRWRIEMFHKVLKSGFKVEDCRLGKADRMIRYLPELPCTLFLSAEEWQVLHMKIKNTKPPPKTIPKIREIVRWIAQLGGFLARKGDGEPGTITLWRGWKRLADLTEGYQMALTCG